MKGVVEWSTNNFGHPLKSWSKYTTSQKFMKYLFEKSRKVPNLQYSYNNHNGEYTSYKQCVGNSK